MHGALCTRPPPPTAPALHSPQPPQAQTKKSESTIKEAIVDSSDEEQDNKPLSRRNVNASTHVQKKVCFALYACGPRALYAWATRIRHPATPFARIIHR